MEPIIRRTTKRCAACWHHKAHAEFHQTKCTIDGLQGNCKDCMRAQRVMHGDAWHALRVALRAEPGAVRAPPDATRRRKPGKDRQAQEDQGALAAMPTVLGLSQAYMDGMTREARSKIEALYLEHYVRPLERKNRREIVE